MSVGFHVAQTGARRTIQRAGLGGSEPTARWAREAGILQPGGVYVWDTCERALDWLRDSYRLVKGATCGWNDLWRVDYTDLPNVLDPSLGGQGAHVITLPSIEPGRCSLMYRFEDLMTSGTLT